MEKENLIDINQISEGCYVVELVYDNRMFPVDAVIKKANRIITEINQNIKGISEKKITEVFGKTPSLSYSLKLIDFVIRTGKSKSYHDYWNNLGIEVVVDCFKIGENECLLIERESKKTTEKEFLLNQYNEKMKLELLNANNNFFISSFAYDIDEGELSFFILPEDLDLKLISDNDPKIYFMKNLLHPDDLSYFEERYSMQIIMAEISNHGEWVTEIRRKCGKEYRYVKCVIRRSTIKENLYFGWEYDTTSEHIINDAEQRRENYFGLYARALESVGRKFYAIYGVDMNDNSIVVINNNEDYAHILYEKIENGKKTVMVNGEYIHPEDYEKVIKFFDLKKLDRGFLNGKEKKSLKFRRIIDWTYQWVNVTATKLYNLGRDLILFSFENINEEIEKDNCINELIKFFKHEYLLSVCVHLDTMSYFAEWKDEGIHSLPDNGYYDTLYNLILTDNYESISSEFKEMFKPNKLVDNFDEKLPKIKKEINLRNKGKIKKYNIELFYRFVDEKKVAYILVKEIEL